MKIDNWPDHFLGLRNFKVSFEPYLVTNTIVPMQFTNGLPLAGDKILPIVMLDQLQE